jgi:GTPase SAR1 family protein
MTVLQLDSPVFSHLPTAFKENFNLFLFIMLLTNILLFVHWIVSTSWDSKFNWSSFIIGSTAILHLHYTNASFVHQYELLFIAVWVSLFYYHISTWSNNYQKVAQKLKEKTVVASLRPFQGSILRFIITVPTDKYADGQWKTPAFGNGAHVVLIWIYGTLFYLHIIPFITPFSCLGAASPLCCRYNYAIQGFENQSVNTNFCSGRVRIAFVGSWSTGKTSIINALLGHDYSTSQIAPAPTTDKFVCLALGASYSAPINSDDYELRRHCEIMSHINDVTHSTCGKQMPNVVDIADENTQFSNFVFFDTPGWQTEYVQNCVYGSFYRQLIDKMDFIYVVWDLNHGKIEDYFADFFKSKTKGTDYELIYNRYEDRYADMAFLNQQYSKMTNGQEILSEMYTMKLHENNTQYMNLYLDDECQSNSL